MADVGNGNLVRVFVCGWRKEGGSFGCLNFSFSSALARSFPIPHIHNFKGHVPGT